MPNLSREVKSLVEYITRLGIPVRVTATLGTYISPTNPCSPHAPGSYHCKPGTDGTGLAVDLATPTPTHDSPGLLRIFAAFGAVESQLAELIYAGAPYNIRNGKRVPPYATAAHHNHVHVAVPAGTFLVPLSQGVKPMYDPPLGPIAAVWQGPDGSAIAAATPDGDVYAWGCVYAGGVKGQVFWGDRKVAMIGPPKIPGKVYCITSTSGEDYNLPV